MVTDRFFHPAALPVKELLASCDVERLRRSGPGGQHRNKVETAIRLCHRSSGVTAMASERRSQSANQTEAVFRLRVNLALDVRTTPAVCPSELWKARTVGGRLLINPNHDDFPALLAEALDALHMNLWDMSQTAEILACTISQLTKLLRHESRALGQVNQRREELGLKPLR